jgi:hypothetical protein
MKNNTNLAIVFLMAGTLLTTAVTTMVPAAYAEGDRDGKDHDGKDHDKDGKDDGGNKIKADESIVAVADCDNNKYKKAGGFECEAINPVELD